MIAVGTLCYLTGRHEYVGYTCVVIGPLAPHRCHYRATGREVTRSVYPVEMTDGTPPEGPFWAAEPHNLIPIAPPGLTEREETREPVHIGDLG